MLSVIAEEDRAELRAVMMIKIQARFSLTGISCSSPQICSEFSSAEESAA
jgi:hypothetical protein